MVDSRRCFSSDRLIFVSIQKSKERCLCLQFEFPVGLECLQFCFMLLLPSATRARVWRTAPLHFLPHTERGDCSSRPPNSRRLEQPSRPSHRGLRGNAWMTEEFPGHALSRRKSCAAAGERGSRQIVARSFRVVQETSGDRACRAPGVLSQG